MNYSQSYKFSYFNLLELHSYYTVYITFSATKVTECFSTVSVYEFLKIFRMYSTVTIFLSNIKRFVFVVGNLGAF
jgi:hypothetical protein